MSYTDLIVSITDKAVRIHRATCKRAPQHSIAAETVLNESIGTREVIQMAKPASCCKPRTEDAQALIDAAVETILNARLETAPPAETAPSAEEVEEVEEDEYLDYLAESDGEEGVGTTATTLTYYGSGLAKHYWKVVGREASEHIGRVHSVKVKATATQVTFTGSEDAVNDAVHTLQSFWEQAAEAFAEWRKTDEAYLAVKAADKGAHWFKSGRAAAEFEKLRELVEGAEQYL